MGITREEALGVLELHRDATGEEIRASYKRLALKWHPDKHGNSVEATQRFQEVSSAYKRLTSTDADDEIHLSRADMFDIFAHVFFQRNGFEHCRFPYESDDDVSDDENVIEDELLHNIAARLRNKYDRSKSNSNFTKSNGKPAHNLSEAEANKNAEELIKEEERERKKAERRRQKKKRNKEKKKQKEQVKETKNEKEIQKDTEKPAKPTIQTENINIKSNNKPPVKTKTMVNGTKTQNTQNKKEVNSKDNKKTQLNGNTDSSEDEPDWDQSSAFFARAAGRNPPANSSTTTTTTTQSTTKTISPTTNAQSNQNTNESEAPAEQLDPVILKSRQLAVRGNAMANEGNYGAAIELFSEAIKMDARDFRFFGNRSYCFDRLGQYEKALQDANVAISLAPEWPKGYFRRGRALAGIKLFSDSEMAFAQVLKLDKNCEDAMFELARVRVQQLEDMGFTNIQSEAAIHQFGTVQSALEALLAGKVKSPNPEDIYVSDGEDNNSIGFRQGQMINLSSTADKSLKSIWVGNVNAEIITEPYLQQIFAQCGNIESVKILPSRFCAFINYSTGESAARAIETLQGFEIGGQNLLLRYPNNSGVATSLQPTISENFQKPKLTGPVNGDECYFWRTTGCSFGERCRNRHIPENRGVDLKKVEAKYGGKL